MLKIEAYIRPSSLPDFHRALTQAGVKGVTVWETRGVGHEDHEKAKREVFRGAEVKRHYIRRLHLETIVEDCEKDTVIKALSDVAESDDLGTVKIFVTPILEALRFPKD